MAGIVLSQKSKAPGRIDASAIAPAVLAHSHRASADALSRLAVGGVMRDRVHLGDIFALRAGGGDGDLIVETGEAVLDGLGGGLVAGQRLIVEGNAGERLGARMRGGRIDVRGNVGGNAGSGMSAGLIHIAGSAGDGVGGLSPGRRYGMTGGTIVVEGATGARTGEKMRRGTIIVRGATGAMTGARMCGGTIVVEGGLGADAGRLMRRGTLLVSGFAAGARVPVSFGDCGVQDLVILRIMARDWARELGPLAPRMSTGSGPYPVRRYAGDLATIGKGEILVPVGPG